MPQLAPPPRGHPPRIHDRCCLWRLAAIAALAALAAAPARALLAQSVTPVGGGTSAYASTTGNVATFTVQNDLLPFGGVT